MYYIIYKVYIKQWYHIVWSVEKIQTVAKTNCTKVGKTD